MLDRNRRDEKIIAIPFGDPQYNSYKNITELPKHTFEELKHFLSVYKELENKEVIVEQLGDKKEAIKIIDDSIKLYKDKF